MDEKNASWEVEKSRPFEISLWEKRIERTIKHLILLLLFFPVKKNHHSLKDNRI
jgi:hypothetical protein